MDREYRAVARVSGITIDRVRGDDLGTFPTEKARLRSSYFFILGMSACIMGYGWALNEKTARRTPLGF